MVDYNDEAHVKHHRMQEILADMRKKADMVAAPPAERDASHPSDDVAGTETPVAAPSVRLVSGVRLELGDDALAIEVLDRWYPQCRAEYVQLLPGAVGHLRIIPNPAALAVAPKAWSFRVRDSRDQNVRRAALLVEVSCNDLKQVDIDPRLGIDTAELEADYYRMALESGKEATLVARDISKFATFARLFPLQVALFNPSDLHVIDILIRVWGEETPVQT